MTDLSDRTLTLELTLAISRAEAWRGWTDPEILVQWFTPAPWKTVSAELDVRPGGSSLIVMQGPNGEVQPNRGVYLDVVPGERLVFTDAFVSAWVPSENPFMVGTVELADAPDHGTLYRATVHHWSTENRELHERMGFPDGWIIAARQLEALFGGS